MRTFLAIWAMVVTVLAADAQQLVWPVGDSQDLNWHIGACGDWPGVDDGCVWLSDKSESASSVWRDVNRFQTRALPNSPDTPPALAGKFHLGADFNLGSGSSDKGQSVRSIAAGRVSAVVEDPRNWGNVVFVEHDFPNGKYTSVYAHVEWLDGYKPAKGDTVTKGQPIALVGNANGNWLYHLHFELREGSNVTLGRGYTDNKVSKGPEGQIDFYAFVDRIGRAIPESASSVARYSSKFGTWDLPAGATLNQTQDCPKDVRSKVGKALPRTQYCGAYGTFDGVDYILHRHPYRKEGDFVIVEVLFASNPPRGLGKIPVKHEIVPIRSAAGTLEFLSVDYDGWNGDPAIAPYDRYSLDPTTQTYVLTEKSEVIRQVRTVAENTGKGSAPSVKAGGVPGNSATEINCNAARWDGTVRNVADLFECDIAKAIESFSAGREILIRVDDLAFAQGSYIVQMTQAPSSVQEFQRRANDGSSSSLDNFLRFTQSYKTYNVICTFPANDGSKLKENETLTATAKLVSYSGERVVLECS